MSTLVHDNFKTGETEISSDLLLPSVISTFVFLTEKGGHNIWSNTMGK
jgi:hypothetical protein